MSQDSIPIRLKRTIEALGLTSTQFADACGMARPNLSAILTGRNKKISNIFFDQIHQAFPKVSIMWLLFGEGPILIDEENIKGNNGELSADVNTGSDDTPMAHEDIESEAFYARPAIYDNLRGLNDHQNMAPPRTNTEIILNMRIHDLESQIEKMTKSPRHVTHITVYYDDSTFETFYSDRSKNE